MTNPIELPVDWQWGPLTEIAELNPPVSLGNLPDDWIVTFLSMPDVGENGRIIRRQSRLLGEVKSGYTRFLENDVLFAKITPCMENGKGALATKLENGYGLGSTEFHVLRANEKGDAEFIYHVAQSRSLRQKAEAYMTGSAGQQRVSADFFGRHPVPLPSLPEQRKIARILTTVDDLIDRTVALIAKLRAIKQGLMHDLLTRGVDEHGQLRPPREEAPELYKELAVGWVPREWEVRTLGAIVKEQGGFVQTGPFGSQLHAEEYVASGVPVIMPQDIKEGSILMDKIASITNQKAQQLARHIVVTNDVVFARRGDLSRCAAISERETGWLCGTGSMLLRPPAEAINARWLSYFYRHEMSQRQILARAVGSTMVNLNSSLLNQLLIACPSNEEQGRIVQRLDSLDQQIASEEVHRHKLQLIKTGLMQDLLTGKVRVTVD